MRSILVSAALIVAAGSASAQDPLSAAKKLTQKAVAATNAHTEAEQRPDGPQKPAATPAPRQAASRKAVPAANKTAATNAAAKAAGRGGAPSAAAAADTAGPPPTIFREVFDYTSDGRRDPFNSLLTTSELRPAMSDLRLTGILYDPSPSRSVATLRDLGTNAQYRVHTGSTLGRMRVSSIHTGSVIFTIEEFGTTRQDSLVLRDSTKVRR